MKLLHLSDLHLGIRIKNYSLYEDQKYILDEILRIVDEEKPDGVLIAGDIYDKPFPPENDVTLFDYFLVELAKKKVETFIISGNHDSAERLAFGERLIAVIGIHLSPVYNGVIRPLPLHDEYGTVNIYMLPFIKPSDVRRFLPDRTVNSYNDAMRAAIEEMHIDPAERNVLVAHQFVTGAVRSESESSRIVVGNLDNVDAEVMDCFDYVALGHIHGPQQIGSQKIRYCGTPLKYSFSEVNHQKSVTVAQLGEKGQLTIRTVPLRPLRDMRVLRGRFEELTSRSFYEGTTYPGDYLHIILTDEMYITGALDKLRLIYPFIMKFEYDNIRSADSTFQADPVDFQSRTPQELFEDLFRQQNNTEMTPKQKELLEKLIREIWGDEA